MLSRGGREVGEDFAQAGADPGQLRLVHRREFFQHASGAGGEPNEHLAAVFRVSRFGEEAVGFHPGHQTDGAVVPDLQLAGEFADRQGIAIRGTANDEHGLVLLRGHAGCEGGRLAKVKKVPEGMTEGGEVPVIGLGNGGEITGLNDALVWCGRR